MPQFSRFLALLCATAHQSYVVTRASVVCRPSVKPVFSETVEQINAKFGGMERYLFTISPEHYFFIFVFQNFAFLIFYDFFFFVFVNMGPYEGENFKRNLL